MPDRPALVPTAVVDGRTTPLAEAVLPVTDPAVSRGDGVFETVGVWDGHAFALPQHLARLERSVAAAGMRPIDVALIAEEVRQLLRGVRADAALRIVLSASGRRLITLDHPPDRPPLRRLAVAPGPWIAPSSPIVGAKSLSYQPNMAALRAAQRGGSDDVLLVDAEGRVLEGSTFGICWVVDGRVEAPELALGILDSISRRTVLELAADAGLDVVPGAFPLERLASASEVLAVSSLRPLTAVERVGGIALPEGPRPVRDRLAPQLDALRRRG